MPGPWTTTAVVLQAAADQFGKEVADLDPRWTRLAAAAVDDGYADLLGVLLPRGYTMGQLDAADQKATWSRDQSLYRLFLAAGVLRDFPDAFVKSIDRRQELRTTDGILVSGSPAAPAPQPGGSDLGGIGVGRSAAASTVDETWHCRGMSAFGAYPRGL